jgi:hypothetical protein
MCHNVEALMMPQKQWISKVDMWQLDRKWNYILGAFHKCQRQQKWNIMIMTVLFSVNLKLYGQRGILWVWSGFSPRWWRWTDRFFKDMRTMMVKLGNFAIKFLFIKTCSCANIWADIVLQVGYDRRVRPNYGGEPVSVGVSLYVLSVGEISAKFMDFTFDMYFRYFLVGFDIYLLYPVLYAISYLMFMLI